MIKDIKIKEKVEMEVPKRGLYVELEWMYGDADGYKNVIVGPFPDNNKNLFIDFLNTLELMEKAYPHGKGGCEDYYHISEVRKFLVLVRKCVGKTILPLNGLFLYLYCYGNNLRLSPSILPPSAA